MPNGSKNVSIAHDEDSPNINNDQEFKPNTSQRDTDKKIINVSRVR